MRKGIRVSISRTDALTPLSDRAAKLLEKFQRRYADLGEEGIDIAGYEKPDSLSVPPHGGRLLGAALLGNNVGIWLRHIFYSPVIFLSGLAISRLRRTKLASNTHSLQP